MTYPRLAALVLLLLLPGLAHAGGPFFDPFVERFAVGAYRNPDDLVLVDGWPAGLWDTAKVDSAWYATAPAILAQGGRRHDSLLRAAAAIGDTSAWRLALRSDLADWQAAGPVTGTLAPVTEFFSALARGDTSRAVELAVDLAAIRGSSGAERVVWRLRAAALSPPGDMAWSGADSLLPELGPWDAANTWALVVALRRDREQPLIPSNADDDHGRTLAGLSRSWLTPADLAAAPYGPDVKAALGAVAFTGAELKAHLASYDDPPLDASLQGYWIRGQRQASRGNPARYEELARREDLHPRWRMDLWRRASERRLLGASWKEGIRDLDEALELARRNDTAGGLRTRLLSWSEQALVLALARERVGDADRILDHIEIYLKDAPDPALSQRIAPWQDRLAGNAAPVPEDPDRVAVLRALVRRGEAAPVVPATTEERLALVTTDLPLWETWLAWGLSLTSQDGIPPDRQAAAKAYRLALESARSGGGGAFVCVEAALVRLRAHPATIDALLGAAFDADVHEWTGSASPPRRSPLPDLVHLHRNSQADLHALLGVALHLEDMRGQLAAATPLPGTGLTRDRKRLFLYPLPGPGLLRDALLAAGNDPALLLAIARNESLFEPAARSRAGALGWMQVMPFHHEELGALPGVGHWSQPASAVARGDGLVTENRRRYQGDPYRLLAAYNAGPGAAGRWDEQLGGAADRALYAAWIGYPETRNYVEKVLIDRDMYDWILDGAGSGPASSTTVKE